MRAIRVFAALSMAALVTACSSSGSQTRAAPNSATTTGSSAAMTRTSAAPTSAASPVSPTVRLLSRAKLVDALLPLSSMPTGYSLDTSTDTSSDDRTFCNYTPPSPVKISVSHTYVKGAGVTGQVLNVGLRQYADPAAARAQFDTLVKVMQTCHKQTDPEGGIATYSLVNTARVGEGTIGIRIDFESGTALQTFTLTGACLASVGQGGVNVDPDVIAPLVKDQVARYEKAAIS
ncbi:MAG: hypothetical protein QOE23_2323 [Pseudonocardiales bacterium]|nr:hypothetical protein [Pseudonocardiales bacterium]